MAKQLTEVELSELRAAFGDVTNYESEDPEAPIDPLSYVAPDGDTCLHIAAHRDDLESIRLLLKAGLDVNARGDMGYTPLHYARSREVFDVLLASNADPSIKNEFGKVPNFRDPE